MNNQQREEFDVLTRKERSHPSPLELNGAQMAAVQKAVVAYLEQIKLRQWCVEKAMSVYPKREDCVAIAREIYDFIVEASDAFTVADEDE